MHVPSGATSGSTHEWHLMDILSVSSLYTAAILGFSIVTKLLSVVVRVGLNSTASVMSCDRSLSRGAKKNSMSSSVMKVEQPLFGYGRKTSIYFKKEKAAFFFD